ncbi:MAG: hypothetical protein Q8R72_12755 [Hylemonella sp.]|nr:hypothetical protein [Hylemonella sp.]
MKAFVHRLSLWALAVTLPATVLAADPPVCPFKPAELESIFGVAFAEGRPGMEFKSGGMTMRDCRYSSKGYSLRVGTTVHPAATGAKDAVRALAGRLQPIPNDPDGAAFQVDQGDATSPTLHYARNTLAVELRIMGTYYSDPRNKAGELRAMQQKLARVRRVP